MHFMISRAVKYPAHACCLSHLQDGSGRIGQEERRILDLVHSDNEEKFSFFSSLAFIMYVDHFLESLRPFK